MSVTISIYSRSAFKEYMLPAGDNMDHTVLLHRDYFGIQQNLPLHMEVLSGIWFINESDKYEISNTDEVSGKCRLADNEVVSIRDRYGNEFRLIPRDIKTPFRPLSKYDISDKDTITIGRAPENDICYDSLGLVSKNHAVMSREDGRWVITNTGKNGIYVDSRRVTDRAELDYGDLINIIGLHILFLGDLIAIDDTGNTAVISPKLSPYYGKSMTGYTAPDEAENEHYDNSSRMLCEHTIKRNVVKIEQPVLAVNGWKEKYREYLDRIDGEIENINERDALYLKEAFPSSEECLDDTSKGIPRWEDNSSDDSLIVRIGTGDIESFAEISLEEGKLYLTDTELYERAVEIRRKHRRLKGVPFTVDLSNHNSVMISCESEEKRAQAAEAIAVQLAQHKSPANLKMAFLYDESTDECSSWSCTRWLPHVWSEDMSCRYFARKEDELGETVYRLSRVLLSREDMTDEEISVLPRYVIFVTDLNKISGTLLEKYMSGKRCLGFTIVSLAVQAVDAGWQPGLLIDMDTHTVTDSEAGSRVEFVPDSYSGRHLDDFVRRIASSGEKKAGGVAIMPEFVSLFDALGVRNAEDLRIGERWAKNRTYDHIKGVLGLGAGNMPRSIDFHERYNGPHALVAGMTGSGKSELLQSLLLSLAIEYSPEDMDFILVDFKGGGMANRLSDLPHVAGCITNLSGSEIERAILAVKSEITRRQRLLNQYGINHIDDFVRLSKNGEVTEPMPHLLIVIDEFAELKKEKPEFMGELISIAQTGRSLGIHLLLATQRPRGAVDEDIRSNMRSVICLRVQDRHDSMDVLDRPDAAYLTSAGRAYLEVGAGEVFEPFQAAYSGSSMMSGREGENKVILLTDDGKQDVVTSFSDNSEKMKESQLQMIKKAIFDEAERKGSKEKQLWLDPLEREIYLSELPDAESESGVAAVLGMIDDPGERKQYPLTIDFPESGNVAIVGMPMSGKSTAVNTLLMSIAGSFDEDSISIYGFDFDSGKLAKAGEEPIVKKIVTGGDVLEAEGLLDEISDMIQERKSRNGGGKICIVLIDSYENFRNSLGYRNETRLEELLREGPGANVYFVLTAGGFGLGQISGRAERNIKTVLSLQQRNKYEYMDALHTSGISIIPPDDIRGRGLMSVRGRTVEFQVALSR